MASYKIGIVGITGAVGAELLAQLEKRKFPVDFIRGFASSRSIGKKFSYRDIEHDVQELSSVGFEGLDFVFFDASDDVSREWVPVAAKMGCRVIDNSAAFRLDVETPLIVPEINADLLPGQEIYKQNWQRRVVAGPNCSTVQLVLALRPIQELFGLHSVQVATYQSVSGAGISAINELTDATDAALHGESFAPKTFPHNIAFNCIPRIGGLKASGRTSEEEKVTLEARKILADPHLRIRCLAVRVPVYRAHSEAVFVRTKQAVAISDLCTKYGSTAGVQLADNAKNDLYPMPTSAAGMDSVFVGRLVVDEEDACELSLWVVSDNLLKGAALNAIQIAEEWVKI